MSTLGTILQEVEADISAEWNELEAEALADASLVWNAVKPILLDALPQQFAILKDLIQTGIADISSMSIEQVETALLNLAVSEELSFIQGLESSVLQAIIAIFKPKTALTA